ncbi:MAG TPA: two-component system sensor histidine kinase RppB [Waterburya sp.]|jgi:signal transduction histidine kinase
MEQNPLFSRTRWRLAGWYAGVMGCILGLCGLGVYHVVAIANRETIDRGLESVANALRDSIEPVLQQPGHLQHLARELSFELCLTKAECLPKTTHALPPIPRVSESVSYYMRLVDKAGRPIALAGKQPERLPITSLSQPWQTLADRQGMQYRQISLPLHSQNHLWGYLQMGRSLSDLDQHLAALRLTLLLGWPIAMLLIATSSWWLAGKAMQPVYQSYQQMRQFTADAAHEFRTPLAAMESTIEAGIRLYGQSQELPQSALESQEFLGVLQRQIARLSQLVGDLLLLTRIDQKELTGEQVTCCLNDLVSDLVEELAFLAIEAGVSLSMQVLPQEPLYVRGNEEQLYRLVSNLMVNAIQATPPEGKVTVVLDQSEEYALIQVQDTGIGIAPEDQSHIFDRFYRVHQDRSRQTGGSGLGLAIAQAIARTHHGSIQVQSQLGLGSTFTVRLPISSESKECG